MEKDKDVAKELAEERKTTASPDNDTLRAMVDDIVPPDAPKDIVNNLKTTIRAYLACFNLRPSEVDKLPELYAGLTEEQAKCLGDLASNNWRLFIVTEVYMLDYLFRRELLEKQPHPLYYLPHLVKGMSNISTLLDTAAGVSNPGDQQAILSTALGLFARALFYMMELLTKFREYKILDQSLVDKAVSDLNIILSYLVGSG